MFVEQSSPRGGGISGSAEDQPVNTEWQLAELIHVVTAELEKAEASTAIKSIVHKVTFGVERVSLEIAVKVRRQLNGRLFFRTAEDSDRHVTTLKIDLAGVSTSSTPESQSVSSSQAHLSLHLSTLPDITTDEISRLNHLSIYTVHDLAQYGHSASQLTALSRACSISEPRLRHFLKLPYITRVTPAPVLSGYHVHIEGGHLGAAPGPDSRVEWGDAQVEVLQWNDQGVTIDLPARTQDDDALIVTTAGIRSNAVRCDTVITDLVVQDIEVTPDRLVAGNLVTLEARLKNAGSVATDGAFEVQWTIDDTATPHHLHGELQPGQISQDSPCRRVIRLQAGSHTVQFDVDPAQRMPSLKRTHTRFRKTLVVQPIHQLVMGDFRSLPDFNPCRWANLGPVGVSGLVFRGLMTWDPITKRSVPDVAARITRQVIDSASRWCMTFDLDDTRFFHDGTPLRATDVAFTYEQLRQSAAWNSLLSLNRMDIQTNGPRQVSLMFDTALSPAFDIYPSLFSVPILPREAYLANPEKFGQHPIGCGPFRVAERDSRQLILDAFDSYFRGRPRLDRITMLHRTPKDLIRLAMEGEVQALVLPNHPPLRDPLSRLPGWSLFSTSDDRSAGLLAQHRDLCERMPDSPDLTWNAHLWYRAPPAAKV